MAARPDPARLIAAAGPAPGARACPVDHPACCAAAM